MTQERLTITRRTGGNRVTFSRNADFYEQTANELIAAGAIRGGIADPLIVSLAGDVLAAEARRLKFAHVERPKFDCLIEAIRNHPACATIWQSGRVDGANAHTFEIIE